MSGNNKVYSSRYPLCQCPWCNSSVAAISKNNFRFSVSYCEEHSQGIKIQCCICNKEYISKPGDVINQLLDKTPIKCRTCAVTELNKSDKMREQARNLGIRLAKEGKGMFSEESKEKAKIASHTKEACEKREITKIKNGFYDKNGGYYKGLKLRKSNGSLDKWIKSGHTSEARRKQNITRWENMSDDEREKKIKRLQEIGFNPSFQTINGTLHYYDKSNNIYTPWEDYKLKFSRKRLTRDILQFIGKIKSLNEFKYLTDDEIFLHSTFRDQNSDSWNGSKKAFEQSLVEKSVNWFTYVKFYIDSKGLIRPLVVGKSGSLLVNSYGSDVNFSESESDGPARRYLTDNGLSWDKTQILVIKAKSEKQALFFENRIANIFNLFES